MARTASGVRVGGVLLVDGWTESGRGWCIVRDFADALDAECVVLPYDPISRADGVVETSEVFPSFFGLPLSKNPGRSGLELWLEQDLAPTAKAFATLRTHSTIWISAASGTGVFHRPSHFSRDGATHLLWAEGLEELQEFRGWCARRGIGIISHLALPEPTWPDGAAGRSSSLQLVGWCHGALLAGLLLSGVQFSGERYLVQAAPNTTQAERLGDLPELLAPFADGSRVPLVYLKDPAWYARNRVDKAEAYEHVVRIARVMLNGFSSERALLCVSDHNSNVGTLETRIGETCAALLWPRSSLRGMRPSVHVLDKTSQALLEARLSSASW